MDLNDIASQVQQDNYLVLASMPNAPTWDEFIQAMRDAGWPPSNDPCGAWLSQ